MALKTVIKRVLDLVSPQWAIEVIITLEPASMRYTDLQHAISVATNQKVHSSTLTAALDHLEGHRLIRHDQASYQLTREGHSLLYELLHPAEAWGDRNHELLDL